MAPPNTGACSPWVTVADITGDSGCAPCSTLTDDQLAPWLTVASDLLYIRSGRQFSGLCTTTVRPCARSDSNSSFSRASYWWGNWAWNSAWGFCSCARPRSCGCTRLSEITLGGYPVVEIIEVLENGAVVDPSFYRVGDYRWLVGIEGDDGTVWSAPCCQRLELDTSQDDTFSVEFTYGVAPPEAGRRAAAEYACQLALACAGSAECRLPSRVQEITRQGVTMVLNDPTLFIKEGMIGLPAVDAFVQTYNPHHISGRAASIPPGARRRVRRTDTGVPSGS